MSEERQLLTRLMTSLATRNSVGTLANLRQVLDQTNFANDEEKRLATDLVGFAHLACFNLSPLSGRFAAQLFAKSNNFTQLANLQRLSRLYGQAETILAIKQFQNDGTTADWHLDEQDVSFRAKSSQRLRDENSELTNSLFRQFCRDHDTVILKTLQRGISDIRRCSWVYLVLDPDGIVKIYKEVLDYNRGPLGAAFDREDQLYELLADNKHLPRMYGAVQVADRLFLRLAVHFGQTLADYVTFGQRLADNDAKTLICSVAKTIESLHEQGVAYLDVKPENFLVDIDRVRLLDLGISRKVVSNNEVDIYVADPRFGTPEGGTRLKASKKSDVFQLGILYQLLLTGKHPFELLPLEWDDDIRREGGLLRFLWPTVVLAKGSTETGSGLVAEMLTADPSKRPTCEQVIHQLEQGKFFLVRKPWQSSRTKERNTVLFPARMGIPHKGHIDYIRRLLALGYHVLISVSRSQVITQRDPIPKWLVGKMVTQSLVDLGFKPNVDFTLVYAPFHKTKSELEYHFAMMPQISDVVAVASGNPQSQTILPGWPIFDQKSLFGTEEMIWENRSWGETIRRAVRQNDYATFREFAASGVEKILPFAAIRKIYGKPHIEFAQQVDVVLVENGREIVRGRVFRYQSPEQSLCHHVQNLAGREMKIVAPLSRNSWVQIDGQLQKLVYLSTSFDQQNEHESIFFTIEREKT